MSKTTYNLPLPPSPQMKLRTKAYADAFSSNPKILSIKIFGKITDPEMYFIHDTLENIKLKY